MNKKLEAIKLGAGVFYYSAKNQLLDTDTITVSATLGLIQGLKYNGNLKQGLKAGVGTLLTWSIVSGVVNVIEQSKKIKEVTK
jgi:hypothetical protein